MALVSQPILDDSPSQKLEELRLQFNALLDVIDAMAADASTLQALTQAGVKKVTLTVTPPTPRKFPTQ